MDKNTQQPVAYITYKGYLLHAADPKVKEHSSPTPLFDFPPVPRDVLMAVLDELDDKFIDEFGLGMPYRVRAALADRYASQVQPEQEPVNDGLSQVDMGFGKFAVGGCQHPETKVPGIVYLHLRDDVRPLGADTTDIYPEGSQAQPKDIAGLIYFHNAFAIQQTIDVLLDMQRQYYPQASTQPEPVNQQTLAALDQALNGSWIGDCKNHDDDSIEEIADSLPRDEFSWARERLFRHASRIRAAAEKEQDHD